MAAAPRLPKWSLRSYERRPAQTFKVFGLNELDFKKGCFSGVL